MNESSHFLRFHHFLFQHELIPISFTNPYLMAILAPSIIYSNVKTILIASSLGKQETINPNLLLISKKL